MISTSRVRRSRIFAMTCSVHRSSGADCANETPSVATVMLRTPNRVVMNLRHIMSLLRRVTHGPESLPGTVLAGREGAHEATAGVRDPRGRVDGRGPMPLINSAHSQPRGRASRGGFPCKRGRGPSARRWVSPVDFQGPSGLLFSSLWI